MRSSNIDAVMLEIDGHRLDWNTSSASARMDIKTTILVALSPVLDELQLKMRRLQENIADLKAQLSEQRLENDQLKCANKDLQRKYNTLLASQKLGNFTRKPSGDIEAVPVKQLTKNYVFGKTPAAPFIQHDPQRSNAIQGSLDLEVDNTVPVIFNSSQYSDANVADLYEEMFQPNPVVKKESPNESFDTDSIKSIGTESKRQDLKDYNSESQDMLDVFSQETELQSSEVFDLPLSQKIKQEEEEHGHKIFNHTSLDELRSPEKQKLLKTSLSNNAFNYGLPTPTSDRKQAKGRMSHSKKHPSKFDDKSAGRLTSHEAKNKRKLKHMDIGEESILVEDYNDVHDYAIMSSRHKKQAKLSHNDIVMIHGKDIYDERKLDNKENFATDFLSEDEKDLQNSIPNKIANKKLTENLRITKEPLTEINSIADSQEKKKPKAFKILNVDQILESIDKGRVVDMTYNPLSGKKWVLEDFKANPNFDHDRKGLSQKIFNKIQDFMAEHTKKDVECEQCEKFYDAAGYGLKMMSPAWDESQTSHDKLKAVMPKKFKCTHTKTKVMEPKKNCSKEKPKTPDSPPGFFKSDFPSTQALKEEKEQAKKFTNLKTMERFLSATSQYENERAFIFRNKIFSKVIENKFYNYDSEKLAEIYET